MVKPHVLLISSLILNTAVAVGCASGFVDRESTSFTGMHKHISDQVLLYRQEAEELRAAAQYYEEEAQRYEQEARQESERVRRYRDFSQQASAQAEEADRAADEYQRQLQSL